MQVYIPKGMLQKEYRWEWVNNQLYYHLGQMNPYSKLKPIITEFIQKQQVQLSILQGMAAYHGLTVMTEPLVAEANEGIIKTLEELYEREYQLLQEYLSYSIYFLPLSLQNQIGIQDLINSQTHQVNKLLELQNTFTNLMNKGSSEAEEEIHGRQQQDMEGIQHPAYQEDLVQQQKPVYILEKGYQLGKIASKLTFPTDITFDQKGDIYIAEAGFAYGGKPGEGRILKLERDGSLTEIAGGFAGPVTSITWYKGYFYVAEGARGLKSNRGCGQITRVSTDGKRKVIVSGLPTCGDHFTGEVIFGTDGKMYFSVGTATNSAVVGTDNAPWLEIHPNFHDVPARTLVLKGTNFVSTNPLTQERDVAITGAYKPFGQPSYEGEVIEGRKIANGVVYCCNPDGSELRVVADGFRNTFGLGFSPFNGKLYVTDNGADPRGNRPVKHDWDSFREVESRSWHGWPDFFSGLPVTLPHFKMEDGPKPAFLLKKHPVLSAQPILRFKHHSSSNKFDFSTNPVFGHVGEVFIAQTGDMDWEDNHEENYGFRVVRANIHTGQIRDFLVNPNGEKRSRGPIRPVEVKFSPDGRFLYIVDFGRLMQEPRRETGAVWKVYRK